MQRTLLNLDEATLRRQRTSIKWRLHGPEVLPLWVAEMDTPAPEPVAAALRRIADDSDLGYPVVNSYLESLSRYVGRAWGIEADPGSCRMVVDVMSGVREALLLLTDPGDPVVITEPVYPPFHSVVRSIGRELVMVPLSPEGRIDPDTLRTGLAGLDRSGGRRAALLLANPHNPTGVAHTAEELRGVATIAREHDVSLVSDEIHAPLVLPGASFTPLLSLPEASGALSVFSPAKGWNLAGLKSGAVIAGPDAQGTLERLPAWASFGASHVAAQVHAAAMDHGGPWLEALIGDLDANRTLLGELLAEHLPEVRWQPMEATYLAWLDVSPLRLDAGRILEEAKVALMDGPAFGPSGTGWVRMNLATSPAIITEAVRRIATLRA